MVDVLLVRHAESVWNATGRWQGQADPPLSAVGFEQARSVALDLPAITLIASSDLQRAHQTAVALAEHVGVASIELKPGVRERDVGVWSGLTNLEIDEKWPGFRVSGRAPEGWEDDSAILERVTPDLVAIAALGVPGPAIVVTHGGVIRLLEQHLGANHQPIGNLVGRWINVTAGGSMALGDRAALIPIVDPNQSAGSAPEWA